MIYQIKIRQFGKANNCNIILFSAKHCYIKKDNGQIVINIDWLNTQEGNRSINSNILYYCKKIPVYLLTNFCILLDIINRAQTLVLDYS